MERKKCRFVRYTASEGKALKWQIRDYNCAKQEFSTYIMSAPRTALIDELELVGEVEEISMEEYEILSRQHPVGVGCF